LIGKSGLSPQKPKPKLQKGEKALCKAAFAEFSTLPYTRKSPLNKGLFAHFGRIFLTAEIQYPIMASLFIFSRFSSIDG